MVYGSTECVGKQNSHLNDNLEIRRNKEEQIIPIVIKEIHVSTVVEKKVILPEEISERTYERLKQKVVEELSEHGAGIRAERGKKER